MPGYAVVPQKSVEWRGTSLTPTPISGNEAGSVTFTFIPSTSLQATQSIKLIASRDIWVGDNFGFAVPDTYRPVIDTFLPANLATNVDIADDIVLTFSERVYPGTGASPLQSQISRTEHYIPPPTTATLLTSSLEALSLTLSGLLKTRCEFTRLHYAGEVDPHHDAFSRDIRGFLG